MSIENTITMPLGGGIGLFDDSYFANQSFHQNISRQFSHEWELDNINVSSTMLPSTSEIQNPISIIGQPATFDKQIAQSNENQNTIENENDHLASHKWFSEYEEMKNSQRKKVNMFYFT